MISENHLASGLAPNGPASGLDAMRARVEARKSAQQQEQQQSQQQDATSASAVSPEPQPAPAAAAPGIQPGQESFEGAVEMEGTSEPTQVTQEQDVGRQKDERIAERTKSEMAYLDQGMPAELAKMAAGDRHKGEYIEQRWAQASGGTPQEQARSTEDIKKEMSGLIPTTSPFEVMLPSAGAAAFLAKPGAKLLSAAATAVATAPESAFLNPSIDEISEESPYIGTLVGLATGLGLGFTIERAVERQIMRVAQKSFVKEVADVDPTIHDTPWTAEVQKKLLTNKLAQGDLRDPDVQEVARAVVKQTQESGSVTAEQANMIKTINRKLDMVQQAGVSPVEKDFTPPVSRRLKAKVEKDVRADLTAEYKEDIAFETKARALKIANDQKTAVTPEITAAARAEVQGEFDPLYKELYDQELADRLSRVDTSPTGAPDRTPPGYEYGRKDQYEMTGRVVRRDEMDTGQSMYRYSNWDASDDMSIEDGRLVYRESPREPVITSPNGRSQVFKYDELLTKSDANKALNDAYAPISQKKKPIPDSRKNAVEMVNRKSGATFKTQQLKDDDFEALAEFLGWKGPTKGVAVKEGTSPEFQKLPEDIADSYGRFRYAEQQSKGWMDYQAGLEFKERDPEFVKMSTGRTEYMSQAKDHMVSVLGDRIGYAQPGGVTRFYKMLDSIMAMNEKLVKDIAHTKGTPDERSAKRMYVLWRDRMVGENNFDNLRALTEANAERSAYREIAEFQGGAAPRVRDGETPDIRDQSVQDDMVGTQSRETGLDPDEGATDVGMGVVRKNLSIEDEVIVARTALHVKDQISAKMADPIYAPGKINILRVNNLANIGDMLDLVPVNPLITKETVATDLGLTPNVAITDGRLSQLATAISTMQAQTARDAKLLANSGQSNVMNAIGFAKRRAILNVLYDQIETGIVRPQNSQNLSRFDISMVEDDTRFVERISEIVDDNYTAMEPGIGVKADYNVEQMIGDMYNDLDSPQARAAFLKEANKAELDLDIKGTNSRLRNASEELNESVRRDCP